MSVVLSSQRDILAAGVVPWSRSRVMVVGEGRVGKSSFINRILGRDFDPNEKSTTGAKTEDVDAKNVRELEGVDIEQAEIGNLWTRVKDEDGLEHRRLVRQEIARKAEIANRNTLSKLSAAESSADIELAEIGKDEDGLEYVRLVP